jgi:hypothetical protein
MIVYGNSDGHAIVRARCMAFIEAEQWYFQSFIAEPFVDYVTRLKVLSITIQSVAMTK